MAEEYRVIEVSLGGMRGPEINIKKWDDFIAAIKLNNIKTVFKTGKTFFFHLGGAEIKCKYKNA